MQPSCIYRLGGSKPSPDGSPSVGIANNAIVSTAGWRGCGAHPVVINNAHAHTSWADALRPNPIGHGTNLAREVHLALVRPVTRSRQPRREATAAWRPVSGALFATSESQHPGTDPRLSSFALGLGGPCTVEQLKRCYFTRREHLGLKVLQFSKTSGVRTC